MFCNKRQQKDLSSYRTTQSIDAMRSLFFQARTIRVCVPLDKDFYTDAIKLHEEFSKVRQKYGITSCKYDGILQRVMKSLLDRVVSKIVPKLKEYGIVEGSHIWWCPTSVLSAFSFHAASPYADADGSIKYLLDDYISSYTPTLTSLISALSGAQNGGERKLFVANMELPSVMKERNAILGSVALGNFLVTAQPQK